MASRLVKRVDLASVIDEQDDSCYAHVRPLSYKEKLAYSKTDIQSLDEEQAIAHEEKWVRERFVRGQIRVLDEKGDPGLVELTIDEVVENIDLMDALFFAILGVNVDPKAVRAMTPSDSVPTETSSSTTSQNPNSQTT